MQRSEDASTSSLAIRHYLAPRFEIGAEVHCSSFESLLTEARSASGRDIATGERTGPLNMSWLGALGYLCLLDQIGSAVRPMGPALNGNGRS